MSGCSSAKCRRVCWSCGNVWITPLPLPKPPQLLENVWFRDESIFDLSGRGNRHNLRIWGKSNPAKILEYERDSAKLVVWCVMSSTGLIGPFFFRDASGNKDHRYGAKLSGRYGRSLLRNNFRWGVILLIYFVNKMELLPTLPIMWLISWTSR